ncbi:MAG TPA: SDR family NAD(P)-dependent oxidoreductase [Lacunisphaera sp.]|nr:SDR family NAD(P)-dependent oxidoreductase [Lacunisphaera sp.]
MNSSPVALITGAGSGIGRATALRLARSGIAVALLGRTAAELRKVEREVREAGGEALAVTADVSRASAIEKAVKRIRTRWGRLDIVVANAGINGLWAPLEDLTPDEWDRTLNINLRGTYLTVRSALPLLKVRGGAVVVVSSVNGTRMFSNTGATAYATSKAGQLAFARMIALELAPFHIRVNTVCPGAIETQIDDNTKTKHLDRVRTPMQFPKGQIPLSDGKPGTSAQVAELIAFLTGSAASHITGAEVFIDGAQSLLRG